MNDLAVTISEMYRLADEYRGDIEGFNLQSVRDVFDYVKNIPFVPDAATGYDEFLRRPLTTINGGDCDDKTILSIVALSNIGVPARIVTTSYKLDGEMEHVYLEVFINGKWQPFDPTYKTNKIFWERPYTKKIIWSRKMNTYKSLGQDPASILEAVQTVAKIFKDLGLGSLFKGKTTYFSEPYTTQYTNELIGPIINYIKNQNDAIKKFFFQKVDEAYNYVATHTDPVSKWQAWISYYKDWPNDPDPMTRAEGRLNAITKFYVATIGSNDQSVWQKNFTEWYVRPILQGMILTPTQNYIKSLTGQVINIPEEGKKTGNVSKPEDTSKPLPISLGNVSNILPIVGIGLLGLIGLKSFSKK
jgi:hypothetical protein